MVGSDMAVAMARGGRPRKIGAERQPDGRPKPEKIEPTAEMIDQRTQELARVIRLYPVNIAKSMARDPDAEWYIGRLRLAGVISVAERDSAHDWRQIADEYARLLMVPKQPHALDMNRRDHTPPPTIEGEKSEAHFKRVKYKYERYWDAVASCGPNVLRATTAALRGEEVSLQLLRKGLQAMRKA